MLDLEPTDAQLAARAEAEAFTAAAAPMGRVRELAESGAPLDAAHLRGAAALGWFSLGITEAAVVAEHRGASLQPGPFVPMAVVASVLAGSPVERHRAVHDAVTRRGVAATWVWADAQGHWADAPPARATAHGDGWTLTGTSGLVQDGDGVEWLLVRARTEPGAERQFLVPAGADGVTAVRLESLDITRSFSSIDLDDVVVPTDAVVETEPDPGSLVLAAALTVAETVGAMRHLLEVAVEHARARVAFGRPIGSFQAIKHLLADASVAVEASTAMASAAVHALADGQPDAGEIVGMAKAFVADASRQVVEACWQTHGGVAYTWEHDFHLSLRRITTDAALYGDADWHRQQLCRAHGLGAR